MATQVHGKKGETKISIPTRTETAPARTLQSLPCAQNSKVHKVIPEARKKILNQNTLRTSEPNKIHL